MASFKDLMGTVSKLSFGKAKPARVGRSRAATVEAEPDTVFQEAGTEELAKGSEGKKGFSIPLPVGLRQKLNLLQVSGFGFGGAKKAKPYQYHAMYKTLIPYRELRKIVDGRAHLITLETEALKVVTSPILKYDESTGRVETLKRIYIRMEKPMNLDLTEEAKETALKKAEQVLEGADFLDHDFEGI